MIEDGPTVTHGASRFDRAYALPDPGRHVSIFTHDDPLALTEQRFQVGTGTNLDVQQARTVLEQTRSTIPALQIVLGQANDTLCILLGVPPRDLEPELGPGSELNSEPSVKTSKLAGCSVANSFKRSVLCASPGARLAWKPGTR